MDPSCDVMVAYKQNDRFLQPDHGFPIRMIIPGHIGQPPYNLAFVLVLSSIVPVQKRQGALQASLCWLNTWGRC